MRRVLVEWRGIRIWSYPALTYIGLVLGLVAQNYAANVAGLDSARVYIATLLLLPIALAGARLFYVATHWRRYRPDPRRIWQRSEGGLAMYGAVPGMLLASVPLLGWIGLPYWGFWDVSTFCLLVGMSFTRAGCLLNGCCSGGMTRSPFGMWLPDERGLLERRIPTQLLEIAWAVALLVAAVSTWRWLSSPGALFLAAFAGYGIGRFVLQPTRASRQVLGPIDLPRAISAAAVVISLTCLVLLRQ